MPQPSPYRALARPLALTALFAAVFFRFWDHAVIYSDSFQFYAPHKFLIGRALRAGEVWGWNPYQYMGMPGVADILAGWFYPLNIIYTLLPFEPAHRLFILLHYPLAAIFMDRLLRDRGLGSLPSLVGALAFSLSGYLVSQHANLPFLIGPALAPLVLLATFRAVEGSLGWALAAGAALALQVLGGEPQSAALTAAAAACVGADRAVTRRSVRPAAMVAVTGLAALLLALAQILPTLEFLRLGVRREGLDFTQCSFYSFHPLSLVELVWPTPFGTLFPDMSYWGQFLVGQSPTGIRFPWAITNFLGLPVLALALYGFINSRRRAKWWVAAATLFFLALALGRHAPVFGLFYDYLPPFRLFRYPAKYLAWFTGLVAAAAALGMEAVVRDLEEDSHRLGRWALGFLAATAAVAAAAVMVFPRVMAGPGGLVPGSEQYTAAATHLIAGGKQFLVLNLAAGAVLLLAARGALPRRPAGVLFLIVLLTDLVLSNVLTMNAGPTDIFSFRPTAAAAISPAGDPRPGAYRVLREELVFRDRDPALADYNRLERRCIWERDTLRPNLGDMAGFEDLIGYNQATLVQGLSLLDRPKPKALELFNVGYVISNFGRPPINGIRTEVVRSDPQRDLTVTRLPDARPRAYWVPSARAARTDAEALELMNSLDLARTVVLVDDEAVGMAAGDTGSLLPAKVVSYSPDRVVIDAPTDRAGWLVLSDRIYPGWKAWVDGKPAKVDRAFVLVRAVRLPAGSRRVEFRFESRPLRLGMLVSAPAWIAVLLYGGVAAIRRHRTQRSD